MTNNRRNENRKGANTNLDFLENKIEGFQNDPKYTEKDPKKSKCLLYMPYYYVLGDSDML